MSATSEPVGTAGPDWPTSADLIAVNRAALEALVSPAATYGQYRELAEARGQTAAGFFRGCERRLAEPEPGAEPEAGG